MVDLFHVAIIIIYTRLFQSVALMNATNLELHRHFFCHRALLFGRRTAPCKIRTCINHFNFLFKWHYVFAWEKVCYFIDVGTLISHFKVFVQCSQHILFYNLNTRTKRIVVSSFFVFFLSRHFIPQLV